jgi:hypothetical protein
MRKLESEKTGKVFSCYDCRIAKIHKKEEEGDGGRNGKIKMYG